MRRARLEARPFVPFKCLYLKTLFIRWLGSIVLDRLRKLCLRMLESHAADFCCPLAPAVSCHVYAHKPCLHPGQKTGNPAGHVLTVNVLHCQCTEKAKEVKGVAVRVKSTLNQNTESGQGNSFAFFFRFLFLLIILLSMYRFLQLS